MEHAKTFDIEIDNELFSLFSDLIYRTSGIKLNTQRKILLSSRLAKRLKKLGINGFYNYYRRVKSDEGELIEMLNCISTNTTNFFREKHHFEYLKNRVIPELIKNKSQNPLSPPFTSASGGSGMGGLPEEKTIRIWSAGCSTGEEPWSIAIAVCEALKQIPSNPPLLKGGRVDLGGWDIKILATDISTKALEIAQAGIYEYKDISGDLSKDMIGNYFLRGASKNEGMVKVKDFMKDMIRFRRLNLKDDIYPFKKSFDVIFCRNVMIYFDKNMKYHILVNFHKHLSSYGHLFLGHSETIFDMKQFSPVSTTVYRKI